MNQTDDGGNTSDKVVVLVTAQASNYKLTIRKRLGDQNGTPIEETQSFRVRVNGPSYPDGLELSIHTYEDTVLMGLLAGAYDVTVLEATGYTVTVSDPVTLSSANVEGVITLSGYFLDPTEKPTDSINNAIAKTGESYNPLMALSFLTAGAALVLFRRKLRSAGDNEEA